MNEEGKKEREDERIKKKERRETCMEESNAGRKDKGGKEAEKEMTKKDKKKTNTTEGKEKGRKDGNLTLASPNTM